MICFTLQVKRIKKEEAKKKNVFDAGKKNKTSRISFAQACENYILIYSRQNEKEPLALDPAQKRPWFLHLQYPVAGFTLSVVIVVLQWLNLGKTGRPATMGFIGTLAKTVVFAVPVSATFFDLVGTVVAVEGVSMQVKLF